LAVYIIVSMTHDHTNIKFVSYSICAVDEIGFMGSALNSLLNERFLCPFIENINYFKLSSSVGSWMYTFILDLWSSFFWDIRQRRLAFSYRGFGTTYWSHLQGSSNQRNFCNVWPLTKGPIFCPETSATNYQYMLYNIPEERRSHLDRGGRLDGRCGPRNMSQIPIRLIQID